MNKLNTLIQKEIDENINALPRPIRNSVKKLVKKVGSEAKPLNIGDKLPDGVLVNHKGNKVSTSNILEGKPAIISFYRGAWCPYCSLELAVYDEILGEQENNNIRMFAVSPEKPDVTMETIEIEKLNLKVFSDTNNKWAKKLGLSHKLPIAMKLLISLKGNNLKKSQGNSNYELPIPGTYVVDKNGIIKAAWVDNDFTNRAEPEEVIVEFKKLV